MDSNFDKEIDQLLRGHREAARRGRASSHASVGDGGRGNGHEASAADAEKASSQHLDADELSAYAENALPAATRRHYAAHLADCDNCRKIVTGIALASGVAGELEKNEERRAAAASVPVSKAASDSWLARLAALFSPRPLQFVAPLLALTIVGVVAYVALHQGSGESSLARREDAPTPASITTTTNGVQQPSLTESNTATSGAAGNSAVNANTTSTAAPDATTARAPELKGKAEAPSSMPSAQMGDVASAPPPSAGASVTGTTTNTELAKARPADDRASQPISRDEKEAPTSIADEASRSMASKAAPDNTNDRGYVSKEYAGAANSVAMNRSAINRKATGGGEETQSRAQEQQYEARNQTRNEQARNERSRDSDAVREDRSVTQRAEPVEPPASRSAPAPASPRGRAARRAEGQTAERPPAQDARPETRSVAGHRFQRQGGAWVDAAYRSGQAVTIISRNSERYRALVADEPELERIARQLDGELTVVWKGRAYRIR